MKKNQICKEIETRNSRCDSDTSSVGSNASLSQKKQLMENMNAQFARSNSIDTTSHDAVTNKAKRLPTPPLKTPSNSKSISPVQESPENKAPKSVKDVSVQRLNVVKEILSTEEGYLQRLNMIDQHFRCHFLKHADSHEKSYPSAKQIEDMFSNLSSILKFHIDFFLPLLKERVEKWNNESRVGDIFVTYGPHFKLYTIYINNYETACSAITAAAKKYPKFEKDLEERQKAPECNHLRLTHHMLDPIQRIPRYKLLLTEYLKYAKDNQAEVEAVNVALDIVSASAQKANDRIRETQNAMKLLEIQQMLIESEDIVAAGRRFIKEGDLSRRTNRNAKLLPCHVFLFSDIILFCAKVSNTKFKKKARFDISEMEIKEVLADKYEFGFVLSTPQGTLELFAQNHEEFTDWTETIRDVAKQYGDKLKSFMLKGRSNSDCASMSSSNSLNNNANNSPRVFFKSNKTKQWCDSFIKLSNDKKLLIFDKSGTSSPEHTFNLQNFNVEKTKEQGNETLYLSNNMFEFYIYSKEDVNLIQRWYQLLKNSRDTLDVKP